MAQGLEPPAALGCTLLPARGDSRKGSDILIRSLNGTQANVSGWTTVNSPSQNLSVNHKVLNTDDTVAPKQRKAMMFLLPAVFSAVALSIIVFFALAKVWKYDGQREPLTAPAFTTIGFFCWATAGLALLIEVAALVAWWVRLRNSRLASGRIPMATVALVLTGYVFRLYMLGTILLGGTGVIGGPEKYGLAYNIIGLTVPYWLARPLAILPVTSCLLRISIVYFIEVPLHNPQTRRLWVRNVLIALPQIYVAIGLAPALVGMSIEIAHATKGSPPPAWIYSFFPVYIAVLVGVDMYAVGLVYLLRRELRRFDLDQSIILTAMSVLFFLSHIWGVVTTTTSLYNQVWGLVVLYVSYVLQLVLVLIYFWRSAKVVLAKERVGPTPELLSTHSVPQIFMQNSSTCRESRVAILRRIGSTSSNSASDSGSMDGNINTLLTKNQRKPSALRAEFALPEPLLSTAHDHELCESNNHPSVVQGECSSDVKKEKEEGKLVEIPNVRCKATAEQTSKCIV